VRLPNLSSRRTALIIPKSCSWIFNVSPIHISSDEIHSELTSEGLTCTYNQAFYPLCLQGFFHLMLQKKQMLSFLGTSASHSPVPSFILLPLLEFPLPPLPFHNLPILQHQISSSYSIKLLRSLRQEIISKVISLVFWSLS
jgi:hypothetical protein